MRERILEYIKIKGPVVPMDIASHFKLDSIFASAHLSDLVSRKQLKISKLKVGSSPLYYLPGDEEKLENFISKLNQKDQETFHFLKEKKIVRDSDLNPLMRVSIRNLKDFAVPLEANFGDHKEIFWKFYPLSNEESYKLIKKIVEPEEEPEEPQKTEPKPAPKPAPEPKQEKKSEPKPKPVEKSSEAKEMYLRQPEEQKHFLHETNKEVDQDDKFLVKTMDYFKKKEIAVMDFEVVKKNSEIDFIVKVPSILAEFIFFCKAKDKKRLNEADLAGAFVGGEIRGLPIILLTNGQLTKQTEAKLVKDFKKVKVVHF